MFGVWLECGAMSFEPKIGNIDNYCVLTSHRSIEAQRVALGSGSDEAFDNVAIACCIGCRENIPCMNRSSSEHWLERLSHPGLESGCIDHFEPCKKGHQASPPIGSMIGGHEFQTLDSVIKNDLANKSPQKRLSAAAAMQAKLAATDQR